MVRTGHPSNSLRYLPLNGRFTSDLPFPNRLLNDKIAAILLKKSLLVKEALKWLQQEKSILDVAEAQMEARSHNQACMTEPDAKLMRSGRDGMVVGYNVQSSVDADSGLIIHHEVTDESDDRRQLYPMAHQIKAGLGEETLSVLADAGYSNGEQLAACDAENITVTLPSRRSINDLTDLYPKSAFHYDADQDCYICPAGECLSYKTVNRKEKRRMYTRDGCCSCILKHQCTKSKQRWVSRHCHEDAFERCDARLKKNPALMRQRMAIVERPFAILKQIMGFRRFLCWGIDSARSEMSLGVLSYNLKLMINREGVPELLAALRWRSHAPGRNYPQKHKKPRSPERASWKLTFDELVFTQSLKEPLLINI